MERIPILKMGKYLLVTVQVDMHDRLAMTLQEDLTTQIVKTRAHGVLIDISSLEIVDSFIGRIIGKVSSRNVAIGNRPLFQCSFEHLHTFVHIERRAHPGE